MRPLLATATTLLILLGTASLVLADNPKVLMRTSKGDIRLELDADKAPATIKNFLTYANEGFYDGTIFHRIIDGFMVQGGGFDQDMKQKATHAPIKNEADNGLKNERGTIAMARTGDPHSATAQFFINQKDNSFLDHRSKDARGWGYAVFGKVTDGMDVVDRIAANPTGPAGPFTKDVPKSPVVIEQITLIGN
jgi:peptidyl-prolyl cis-trans isomerase B (cyclophilin B)